MTSRLPVNGGHVAYEVFGTGGRPVVTLPGIGDTRASYRALVPLLVEAGFTVYSMDLRGHGDSDAGFASYTSEDIGDDVVALLEALDLRDAVLVVNSVGGAASCHAALRTDRAGCLVLLSAFISDPPSFGLMRPLLALMFAGFWGCRCGGATGRRCFRPRRPTWRRTRRRCWPTCASRGGWRRCGR